LTVAGSLFFMKKSFKGSRVTIFFLGLKARTVPATVNRRFASLFREIHGHSLFFQKERGRLKKSARVRAGSQETLSAKRIRRLLMLREKSGWDTK
jgi:hypothetical protein